MEAHSMLYVGVELHRKRCVLHKWPRLPDVAPPRGHDFRDRGWGPRAARPADWARRRPALWHPRQL